MEQDAMVVRNIINDLSLNYIEKRDILQEKVDVLIRTITSKAAEVEERKKDIAKF
ncbi:MAG: hypothetical protein LBI53_02885 [Candidatus Peribacteria bacterium]|jgi:hypothetical protein|nr:hypothetical protein [Candidatus Peribacteria bacterium]